MADNRTVNALEPKSPCVRNCCLDETDTCLGCFRTLREICDWHSATVVEKNQVLAACEQRKQKAKK